MKDKLIKLIDELTENEIIYLFHFVTKLFCVGGGTEWQK